MNKLNKIDYELRGMKMPFLSDTPLASSYAEKSGYATMSENTYSNFSDDYSYADGNVAELESKKYEIDQQLSDVDADILKNSDAITEAVRLRDYWIGQRDLRVSQVAEAQRLYDEINAVKKKNRREEDLKQSRLSDYNFYNGHLTTARANANSYASNVNSLNQESIRLSALKSSLIQQKADLIDSIAKGKAREILANQGTTPEAKEKADEIIAKGKAESDVLKAEAENVSLKDSSKGKLFLIIGAVAIVGVATILLLKK